MLMRFLDQERDPGLELVASHDPLLVACSIVAAVIAAYAALGVIRQIKVDNSSMLNLVWLMCGASVLGIGIWCMHFIAMLAYRLPVAVYYDLWITVISVIPAIVAAILALYLVSWPTLRSKNLMLGGLLIGAGIGAMHYIGMAAMHLAADMLYSLSLVVLSVVVAVGLAALSLFTLYAFSRREITFAASFWARPIAALIMGIAVSGMHYTAMAAVHFYPLPDATQLVSDGRLLGSPQLATVVLLFFGLVVAALVITIQEIEHSTQALLLANIQQQNTSLETMVGKRTRELQEINAQLEQRVTERTAAFEASNRELEAMNQHGKLLAEVSELLQTVLNRDEAMRVISSYLERLFPQHQGALYLNKPSRSYLELRVHWGEKSFAQKMEMPDCWGIRRGRSYLFENATANPVCAHTGILDAKEMTLCIPLLAHGETLGLLHLRGQVGDPQEQRLYLENAQRAAEQLSVGLANLNLREALRDQSIHDVQTGLYNRRFLEESLPRELARAEREKYPVTVFMLDVDHFKKFNDSYGHEAGDAVLHALGRMLNESVRASDLAYHFGGEEFTVALPRVSFEQARDWADRFMQRVRDMEVKVGGQPLPGVTVSMGLAFACLPFSVALVRQEPA